jgi:hypothetical protein
MLSFEITQSGKSIQIFCDREGLLILRRSLDTLERLGHMHLRSPDDLASTSPFGDPAIQEVIFTTGGDDDPSV